MNTFRNHNTLALLWSLHQRRTRQLGVNENEPRQAVGYLEECTSLSANYLTSLDLEGIGRREATGNFQPNVGSFGSKTVLFDGCPKDLWLLVTRLQNLQLLFFYARGLDFNKGLLSPEQPLAHSHCQVQRSKVSVVKQWSHEWLKAVLQQVNSCCHIHVCSRQRILECSATKTLRPRSVSSQYPRRLFGTSSTHLSFLGHGRTAKLSLAFALGQHLPPVSSAVERRSPKQCSGISKDWLAHPNIFT